MLRDRLCSKIQRCLIREIRPKSFGPFEERAPKYCVVLSCHPHHISEIIICYLFASFIALSILPTIRVKLKLSIIVNFPIAFISDETRSSSLGPSS